MLYLLLAAWLWLNQLFTQNKISRDNQARQEAQLAYRAGDYRRALSLYSYLNAATSTADPAVRLNLGHTYFQLKQYAKAKAQYGELLQLPRPDLRTVAAMQLGVISCLEGDSAVALTLFRQALLENADNESARYNFELVKTYYSGKPPAKSSRPKPTNPKPKPVEKPRPVGGQDVERSARHDELLRRFQRLNISEAQALQLLDAMRSDDLPYALTKSARHTGNKSVDKGNRW